MKKFWKYIMISAAAVALMPLAACDDDDTVDPYDINYCYIYQPSETDARLEYKANGQFIIDITDPLKLMPVRLTKPAPSDITVTVGLDASLVDEYNATNGTDYVMLEGATIVNPEIRILKGEYISTDSITVAFDHNAFQTGDENYILPVVLKSASGLNISKSSRIFLTFTSEYRANIVSLTASRNLVITNDPDVTGWETANRNVTINNFLTTTWAADAPITVKAEIDQSLIDAYNAENGTTYKPIQASVNPANLVIAEGQSGVGLSLTLGDYTGVANGDEYLIPVKLSFESGTGAELAAGVDVAYVQVIALPSTVSSTASSNGLSQITPQSNWTGLSHTVNYGDEDFSSILLSNSGYYGVETGDQLVIDLGQVYNDVKAFGFQFYAWYYGLADIQDVEVSTNGSTWKSFGGTNLIRGNYDAANQYIVFSKPTTFQYLRFTCGDYGYSSYYGCFIRQIKFYN